MPRWRRARWRRGRSRRGSGGGSACLCILPRTTRKSSTRIAALRQGLQHFGWADGGNMRIDYRWAKGEADLFREGAKELVQLAPRCPCGQHQPRGIGSPRGNSHAADRLRQCRRSCWCRIRCKFSGAWRQRHRLRTIRVWYQCQVGGIAKTDRSQRDAHSNPSGCDLAGVGQLGAMQAVGSLFGVETDAQSALVTSVKWNSPSTKSASRTSA